MDVGWRLRLSQNADFQAIPAGLHAFSMGRWECALSAVSALDTVATGRMQAVRTRRLACTHATGITVQSALSCALSLPRTPIDDDDTTLGRTLSLSLSDAATLELVCLPAQASRLPRYDAAGNEVGSMCLKDERVLPCPPMPEIQ